ncbi:hypothetical protein E2C01_092207 [Portunus trituberculatus]|uniref:Uncharacterized protein n=1 Tax=Portunus trituberculatus TaxID=210409 RepID=A0A5B7JQS3_PORTR|nr:hypothetical protein [Portunus trituberculatus]
MPQNNFAPKSSNNFAFTSTNGQTAAYSENQVCLGNLGDWEQVKREAR